VTGELKRGFLERAERAGRLAEDMMLVSVLAGMTILAALQILLRNVFNMGLPWADEALRLMVLWIAMLGAVAASRDERQISIDALPRILPDYLKPWAAVVVNAFTAAVALVLAWYSWVFVADAFSFGDRLLGELPAWIFQSVLPAGFFLIGYRYVVLCLRRLRDAFSGPHPS